MQFTLHYINSKKFKDSSLTLPLTKNQNFWGTNYLEVIWWHTQFLISKIGIVFHVVVFECTLTLFSRFFHLFRNIFFCRKMLDIFLRNLVIFVQLSHLLKHSHFSRFFFFFSYFDIWVPLSKNQFDEKSQNWTILCFRKVFFITKYFLQNILGPKFYFLSHQKVSRKFLNS